jgi:DNA sulfur modification protein DndD
VLSREKYLEEQLLALAAGDLPLALVPDLLERVRQQDQAEQEAAEAQLVLQLLAERDRQLLEVLRAAGATLPLLQLVSEFLGTDRQSRQPASSSPRRLGLSESSRSLLHHLQGTRLRELAAEAARLLAERDEVHRQREDLERLLAALPEEGDIRHLAERFKTATQDVTLLTDKADRLDAELKSRREELDQTKNKLARVWQGEVEKEFQHEDARRMVHLAERTRQAMQQFLPRATAQKIERLSTLITECFRFLLRKQTLVERIRIDPADFAVTLHDPAGQALSRQRLSEGEKQIFAIGMLWGLARASARPLPAMIDTPMARLDAAHRQHLVERYFPNASHQVIILSTDTEVDKHYYQVLQPAIARAYHLSYDEERKVTVGEEGYFWKE